MYSFTPFSGTKKIIVILTLAIFSLSAYSQTQRPVLTLPIGHQQPVHTVDFSKDGKLIVTGGTDNTFILWDAKTGFIIRSTRTESAVQQVLFTPDGTQLITLTGQSDAKLSATEKPVVQKWDVKTGKLLMKLPFTASPGIQFLPSGYILVPDYSDDLSKSEKSFLQEYDISNPDKISADIMNKYNDKYMDSLADAMSKDVKKPQFDYSNPEKLKKQMEEYQKETMERMMGGSSIAAITKRNITLLDPNTLKPVAVMTKSPENIKLLVYNNIEYLVSQYESTNEMKRTESKMEALEVKEFINQYRQKMPVKAAKEFPIKQDINKLAVSSEKGLFAVDIAKTTVQLWQIDKAAPINSFKTKGNYIANIDFSPDGNTLYVFSLNPPVRYIEAWNTSTASQTLSIQLPKHFYGTNIYLAKSGDYFAADYGFGLVKLSLNGDSLAQLHGNWAMPSYYGFSKNDKEVYVAYNVMTNVGKTVGLGEAEMRKQVEMGIDLEAKLENKVLTKAEKDKLVKERMALVSSYTSVSPDVYKGYMLKWDLLRGGANFSTTDNSPPQHKTVSADNNYQVMNQQYESGYKESGKQIKKMMEASQQYVTKEQAELLKNAMQMENSPFTDKVNGPVTLLINRKKDTVSLIKVDSTDWIMLLKNGYYLTSQNGAKSLSYTRGLDVMPFQQFDLKYNRPDKVLQAIGLADATLIEAYKNAWLKRIKKNAIDTTQFRDEYEVPVADFDNRNKIEHDQKTEKLSLTISGSDSKNKLDRFNIWVNEVPVFGKNGKSIKDAKSSKLNTTVEVTLSQGTNRIETSVMNANGVESYHVPLFVKYTPDKPVKEITHFVGIGIDQFADNKYNLQYSAKDIRDLSKKLKEKYGAAIVIDTLFNQSVTAANVKALKQKLQQTTENDKVIIAYSGHGMLSKDFDYYLSTYSINFEKPEQNGLSYDDLEDLVDNIPARKKLMLIDACHSGEVDKEDLVTLNASPASLVKGIKPVAYKKDGQLGLKNSFELMQSLFVNVGKSTGATIISAAAGTQFALERGDLKNGVFTYSILEAMNKYPTLKISELKKIVGERVEQLTNGLQKPTSRNETIAVDWNVW